MGGSPTFIINVVLVTLLPGSVGLGLHLPGSPEPNSGCRSFIGLACMCCLHCTCMQLYICMLNATLKAECYFLTCGESVPLSTPYKLHLYQTRMLCYPSKRSMTNHDLHHRPARSPAIHFLLIIITAL